MPTLFCEYVRPIQHGKEQRRNAAPEKLVERAPT